MEACAELPLLRLPRTHVVYTHTHTRRLDARVDCHARDRVLISKRRTRCARNTFVSAARPAAAINCASCRDVARAQTPPPQKTWWPPSVPPANGFRLALRFRTLNTTVFWECEPKMVPNFGTNLVPKFGTNFVFSNTKFKKYWNP